MFNKICQVASLLSLLLSGSMAAFGFVAIRYMQSPEFERDPSKYTAEGVRYDNFVPLLVNLLKRQKSQIEVLETKVAALEAA